MKHPSTATRSEYKPKVLWSSSSLEEPRGQGNSRLEMCPSAKHVSQAKPWLCHRSDLDKRGLEPEEGHLTYSESSFSHTDGVLEAPGWKFPQGALSSSEVSTNQPRVIAQHSRKEAVGPAS